MKQRKSLTVSMRIWALSFIFSSLVLFIGGYGEYSTIVLSRSLDKISNVHLVTAVELVRIDMFHDGLAAKAYKALENATVNNQSGLNETKQETIDMAKDMKTAIESLQNVPLSDQAKESLSNVKSPLKSYIDVVTEIVEFAANGDRTNALTKMPQFEKSFEELEGTLGSLGELLERDAKEYIESSLSESKSAQIWNVSVLILGLVAGLFIARYFVREIYNSLSTITKTLASEAANLAESSSQISLASTVLAESTTEQSSSIEETVSSMEEMASMIAQTNHNAEATSTESHDAISRAQEGKIVVQNMVESMKDISASNEKIQSIVRVIGDIKNKTKVINDIAFETRLLAFNASIEAARAGAHGRGFAVVAEEVGKLANTSGKAADEVRDLLENSLVEADSIVTETKRRVEDGERHSHACEQAFVAMEAAINQISDGIQKISAATREQEIGVKQTNLAMIEMEKVTQSNSRNAERLSTQSTALKSASTSMQENSARMGILVWGQSKKEESQLNQSGNKDHHSGHMLIDSAEKVEPSIKQITDVKSPVASGDREAPVERDDSRWHAA